MSKYRAVKTECLHGHIHDSGKEAARCNDLHAMQLAGTLCNLTQQPEFPVSINGQTICVYRADFGYTVQDCKIIEDVKGYATREYKLKKKMVEAAYPGVVITEWPVKKKKVRKLRAKAKG